jgi:hypothetical protein
MRLRHALIRMGRFRRFWFGGVSFFCSIGKDDASFYQRDRVFVKLCSVSYESICCLPHMAIIYHQWERIQGYSSPTHWGICLLKLCIFYSLDRRSEWLFARTWKRTSWWAPRYTGFPWGPHGCSWDAIWVNKCAKKKRALFNHLCRSNVFFVVKACIPVHMLVRQSKNCEFQNKRRLVSDKATGNPNLDHNRPQNEI